MPHDELEPEDGAVKEVAAGGRGGIKGQQEEEEVAVAKKMEAPKQRLDNLEVKKHRNKLMPLRPLRGMPEYDKKESEDDDELLDEDDDYDDEID